METQRIVEAEQCLSALGMPHTETNVHQMDVFIQAMRLFEERNSVYQDLWKETGLEDNLHHVKHKAMRAEKVTREDDLFDLINYTVFSIRCLREKPDQTKV